MRPTYSQKLNPHAFFYNSIPFPGLREVLCGGQVGKDTRHTLSLYIPSLRFKWPKDKDLIVRDAQGLPGLHPDFEVTVGNIRNWSMGPPWTDMFPNLMQYLDQSWPQEA